LALVHQEIHSFPEDPDDEGIAHVFPNVADKHGVHKTGTGTRLWNEKMETVYGKIKRKKERK
jgi:hypothetical protein